MLESYPSYYWVAGRFILPLLKISDVMPQETRIDLITSARQGLLMLLREPSIQEMLPRTTAKANAFLALLEQWMAIIGGTQPEGSAGDLSVLRRTGEGFAVSFQDELDRLVMFTVTPKGSLDIHRLVDSVSETYPKNVREFIDEFVVREIDHAGRCLAFELPTSCGFHILRAVETCLKAFCYAETGKLPPHQNRNWGQYIDYLNNAKIDADVIDVLRMLKTKRNPLMHPTDVLTRDQAISLLCICQGGIEAIIADVRKRSLDIKFKEALGKMPTL
jgi:hypothetical protein